MNDHTAAQNLEITAALAEAAEEILREFAEDAELDIALIVDHSGGLVAGISADENVQVETVGALVAGAVGSVKALGKAIGESKPIESIHHGTDNTIYLRQVTDRFNVVGIASSSLPSGIIREKAAQISAPLYKVLTGVSADEQEAIAEPLEATTSSEPIDKPQVEPAIPEAVSIPPLVIDSPFEIAFDDDDDDEIEIEVETELEDVKEEVEEISGEFFEFGGFEIADDEDEEEVTEGDGDSVSAPFLVEPALPTVEQLAQKMAEDATTSVAAISTPIATGILKKAETPPAAPVGVDNQDNNDANPEFEEAEDDDEPVGGPRYVFEIG